MSQKSSVPQAASFVSVVLKRDTLAFGCSAPHPSAGGTLTLLTHTLPSAHYGEVRLLGFVHHRLRFLTFPMRTGYGSAAPVEPETSQVPMRSFCT